MRRLPRLANSHRVGVDYHTAPQLADVLDRRVAEGQTVLIDLTALDFIDSSGMRVILLVWKRSQRDGFDLRLTRSSETVMSTFEVAGLIGELPFTEQA